MKVKKKYADVPVTESVKKYKKSHDNIALSKFLQAINICESTFFRYDGRIKNNLIPVQKSGRKKVEFQQEFNFYFNENPKNNKSKRKRFKSTKDYSRLPRTVQNEISERFKAYYNQTVEQEMHQIRYCEPHLIWAMDISEYNFEGYIFHVLQVVDLGSRRKFEPEIKIGAFTSDEVSFFLNCLMHKYGEPLFLKRDNGTNLKGYVENILETFGVIPLNSPPYCPRYNGVIERAQGEIKQKVIKLTKGDRVTEGIRGTILYAINESNNKKRAYLNTLSPLELWEQSHRNFNRWERGKIYKEIKNHVERIVNGLGLKKHQIAGAWRAAIRYKMEELEIISIKKHGNLSDNYVKKFA